jgi:hypothetical protein
MSSEKLRFLENDYKTLQNKAAFQSSTMLTLGQRVNYLKTTLGLVLDVVVELPKESLGEVPETHDASPFYIRDILVTKITEALEQ